MIDVQSPSPPPDREQSAGPSWTEVAELADQCVMCGLCLPHCPTYRVRRQESESPRGRIALAQALARGDLADPGSARLPLQHCVGCLSCEVVCPAKVRYGDLITQTRALLPPGGGASARWVRRLAGSSMAIRVGGWLHRCWSRLGRPTRVLPSALARLARGVPAYLDSPHSREGSSASIWLFSGCASAAIDQPARTAAARLLAALGQTVNAHPHTGCCGQLQRMAGERDQSDRLAAALRQRLDAAGVVTLVSVGSGCYSQLCRSAGDRQVMDLGRLLLELEATSTLRFRPHAGTVSLHLPCTQRSEVRDEHSWSELLGAIPQLRLSPIRSGPTCCGAAGTHFLDQPTAAEALRSELLDNVAPTTELLLTTNPGCAAYLRAGLAEAGRPIRVAHPVELLAELLIDAD